MREFFRGWKRKVGTLTLVIACVFTGGWVRSLIVQEEAILPLGTHRYIAVASDTGLLCVAPTFTKDTDVFQNSYWNTYPKDQGIRANLDAFLWQFHISDFGIGRTANLPDGFEHTVFIAPYWSLVIPCAALSAWLLLSKPRKKPPTPERSVQS